jgi:hypothetical protein
MSGPDRRHAVEVARGTLRLLQPDQPRRDIVAAALLHDVGKVESEFGTFARVGVTLVAIAVGRRRLVSWAEAAPDPSRLSLRRRTGLYLSHDRLGAALLGVAGSEALTVNWAREHHSSPARWTVDGRVGAALKEADGD